MKGVTFKTKIEYIGIPAGTIVQGVAMVNDGIFGLRKIGVALAEDHGVEFQTCAGYGPGEACAFGVNGTRGGWWFASRDLEPLTAEARAFVAAHLADGGE